MHVALILVAVAAVVATLTLLVRHLRARSDERLQWQATRQRDWSDDELDTLSRRDTGEVAEVVV